MLDELLAANREYANTFTLRGIPARAAKGFGLVTCIDTRIDPLTALGLHPGDAKILRNAGGRCTPDVLRTLVLATNLLGVTHVAVMHHTDCALANRSDPDVASALAEAGAGDLAGWEFLSMQDPDAALASDVEAIRSCTALRVGLHVEGWRYDVDTGLVHRIVTP